MYVQTFFINDDDDEHSFCPRLLSALRYHSTPEEWDTVDNKDNVPRLCRAYLYDYCTEAFKHFRSELSMPL